MTALVVAVVAAVMLAPAAGAHHRPDHAGGPSSPPPSQCNPNSNNPNCPPQYPPGQCDPGSTNPECEGSDDTGVVTARVNDDGSVDISIDPNLVSSDRGGLAPHRGVGLAVLSAISLAALFAGVAFVVRIRAARQT
ncbi:MAG TPA: hypothetical protein VM262_18370 [Acidimicrobiales bacterium]|nr:hypothetical protein [Acidimicrobiales bacterium]